MIDFYQPLKWKELRENRATSDVEKLRLTANWVTLWMLFLIFAFANF